ncbi:MAG: hypothetical protein M3065_17940 [Actinomycetota bacterium]|nr:hypothetical protein [Actinomycetota bacterium]
MAPAPVVEQTGGGGLAAGDGAGVLVVPWVVPVVVLPGVVVEPGVGAVPVVDVPPAVPLPVPPAVHEPLVGV